MPMRSEAEANSSKKGSSQTSPPEKNVLHHVPACSDILRKSFLAKRFMQFEEQLFRYFIFAISSGNNCFKLDWPYLQLIKSVIYNTCTIIKNYYFVGSRHCDAFFCDMWFKNFFEKKMYRALHESVNISSVIFQTSSPSFIECWSKTHFICSFI